MKRIEVNIDEYTTGATQPRISYNLIKKLCHSAEISMAELVKRRNELHPNDKTTPQNLSNKLSRDSLKLSEFIELANCAGFKMIFEEIEKDNRLLDLQGNPLTSESHKEPEEKATIEQEKQKTFTELLTDGFCEVQSQNFESAIVAGTKCEKAARWIEANLKEFDYDETQEVMLYIAAARQFKVKVKPISSNPQRNIQMI